MMLVLAEAARAAAAAAAEPGRTPAHIKASVEGCRKAVEDCSVMQQQGNCTDLHAAKYACKVREPALLQTWMQQAGSSPSPCGPEAVSPSCACKCPSCDGDASELQWLLAEAAGAPLALTSPCSALA